MNSVEEFIQSGILELYVMGVASPEEVLEVELMALKNAAVREELDAIRQTIEGYAVAHAVAPKKNIKPLVLATIDYLERMKKGEPALAPPVLSAASNAQDFAAWLEREDMLAPADEENIFAKIIGFTPQATTAIVWIQDSSEQEVHHDELERFLILEGTCTITVNGQDKTLKAGDFFEVPLHAQHYIKVTSNVPCKAILQRVVV